MPETLGSKDGLDEYFSSPCPCSNFRKIHPGAEKTEAEKRTASYYKASGAKGYVTSFLSSAPCFAA
jgi:hypothetical protein